MFPVLSNTAFLTHILSLGCFATFMIIFLGIISGIFSEYDAKNRKVMGGFVIMSWIILGVLLARANDTGRVAGGLNCVLFLALFVCLLIATAVTGGFATRNAIDCSAGCKSCAETCDLCEKCKEPCKDCASANEYKIESIGRAGIAFFVMSSLIGSTYYTWAMFK